MVSLAGASLVSAQRLPRPLTSTTLHHSLIAGFVLSLLGTIVLTFGMLLLFAGTFTLLISYIADMPLTLRDSAIYLGNYHLSHWNWLSYRSVYNSRYLLKFVAKTGMKQVP
jgi:hypothetical protein